MQNSRKKTVTLATAIFLMASMAASMVLLPSASAHGPGPIGSPPTGGLTGSDGNKYFNDGKPWQIPTHAYIQINPNPIGIGQQATVYLWLDQVFGSGFEANAYAALNNQYRFHNYNLTIIQPDGSSNSTIYSYISDPTSAMFLYFTPTAVGTYTFLFSFPGQAYAQYPGGYNPASVLVNDTYLPSQTSGTLTVQQQAIPPPVTGFPLPTQYWVRPIYGENTNWWSISSNWLGQGTPVISATGSGDITAYSAGALLNRFPGDAIGPLTSHIMWTRPDLTGGVVGGNRFETQGITYFEGSAYNQRFSNPIILNGKLYYTETVSFTGVVSGPTDCIDLRTGQVLWSRTDIPQISFGFIWDHEDPDQHGAFPAMLATANFARLFDADTGNQLFNVTGVPTSFAGAYDALGPDGETLKYVMINSGTTTNPNYVLAEWNSSKLWNYATNPYTNGSLLSPSIINATSATSQTLITTIPIPITGTTGTSNTAAPVTVPYGSNLVVNGGVFNSSDPQNRYDWNYTISWRNTMTPTPTILAAYPGNMLLLKNGSYSAPPQTFAAYSWTPWTYFAVNLNASRGTIGSILWTNTVQPPTGNLTVTYGGSDPTANGGAGVFVEGYKETMQWVGYSLSTGQKLWGPIGNQSSFDYYGNPIYPFDDSQLAYGKLYTSAYGGIMYAYDLTTGNLLWTYGNNGAGNSTNGGFNVFYGHYPTFINAVGNGVLYLVTSEHTVPAPLYKGAMATAINATDGTEIWRISSVTTEFASMSYAIADGYATWFNSYDDQIYSVGKGPTVMTVTASPSVSTFGNNVVIQGTVMDISAGTKQSVQAANFPNGVPVASDAGMGDWMGFVYQQKPCPTNFTGVPVSIYVLDSNGNYRSIGTATSDASGVFSFTWKPDITGDFRVTASFAGTNSYWPSAAETTFNTMQASATAAPGASPGPSVADQYFVPAIIGLFVLVIIVAIVLSLLIMRRRP